MQHNVRITPANVTRISSKTTDNGTGGMEFKSSADQIFHKLKIGSAHSLHPRGY